MRSGVRYGAHFLLYTRSIAAIDKELYCYILITLLCNIYTTLVYWVYFNSVDYRLSQC
jgi:hypothetical protein